MDRAQALSAAADLIARAHALRTPFADRAAEHDATGEPTTWQFQALFEADLLRLTIAPENGGHGAGLVVARQVVSEIAQGDPSVALILTMHYSYHAGIARAHREPDPARDWPPHLIERVTQACLTGVSLINSAQVEPNLGSPSHGGLPDTVARRVGDRWRLSGHKAYVTGVPLLSWMTVLARTDEPIPRIGLFLVSNDAPGVEVVKTWDPIGMRATASHDVILRAVAVPIEDTIGLRPASLGLLRDHRDFAWYLSMMSSVYDGAARAGRDWLADFFNTRKPNVLNGAPLASLPTIQEALGRIEVLLGANAWLLDSHAAAFDAGTAPATLGPVVKHTVIDNAAQSMNLALELAGNHGLTRRNPLERHHRNALCGHTHAPPNALIRGTAGRAALAAAA
ncbi:acyl-CoA dehydrogenase family protein [Alcaligenaceae bacterium C4P045]|nr:acyl-CoA dehydrogenase family protein [Alcaligenaceae bacterium C4P045]